MRTAPSGPWQSFAAGSSPALAATADFSTDELLDLLLANGLSFAQGFTTPTTNKRFLQKDPAVNLMILDH